MGGIIGMGLFMEFVIRDIEGNEHGPVDQETLIKWVEDDRVTAKTEVRNSLLGTWKRIDDLEFLREMLDEQKSRELAVEDNLSKAANAASKIGSLFRKNKVDKKTAFACKYVPMVAPPGRRFYAWVFDLLPIALIALMLFSYSIGVAKRIAVRETGSEELRKEDILADTDPDWVKGEKNSSAEEQEGQVKDKTSTDATAVDTVADAGAGDEAAVAGEAEGEEDVEALIIAEVERIPDIIPDNLTAVGPPSIYADNVNGYYIGSIWQNKSSGGKRYVCIGTDEGAAQWITVTWLRRTVTTVFSVLVVFALLYYGICLGFFAQTFGMWYWGIFIVKKDTSEVFFMRAMVWTVLMMTLGVISPLSVYLFRKAPHDLIAKVKIIQVAGTPPAG